MLLLLSRAPIKAGSISIKNPGYGYRIIVTNLQYMISFERRKCCVTECYSAGLHKIYTLKKLI